MLEQLLRTERERDETLAAVHDYLTQLGQDMRAGTIPPEQFLIAKVLRLLLIPARKKYGSSSLNSRR